jgi:hypothetical protein
LIKGDHGNPQSLALSDDQRAILAQARQHEAPRCSQECPKLLLREPREEPDSTSHPGALGKSLEPVAIRAISDDDQFP